jgi:hypothetical protein
MPTVQQQIVVKFLANLAQSPDLDKAKIEQLRLLMTGDKQAKAEDFVRVFSMSPGGDIK